MQDDKPITRDARGRFPKGTTGNPAGRPVGSMTWAGKARMQLRENIQPIIDALMSMALQGDVRAAGLLLERCLPPLKAGDDPVTLADAGDLGGQARAIMSRLMDGTVTPAQGADLLAALSSVARITEVAVLEQRIAALEAMAPRPS